MPIFRLTNIFIKIALLLFVSAAILMQCRQNIEPPAYNNILDVDANFDDQPPLLKLTVDPDSGIAGETEFILNASGSKEEEMPDAQLKYLWDFDGDNIYNKYEENNELRTHVFQRGGGERSIYLKVEGAKHLFSDTTINIVVNSRPHIQVHWKQDAQNPDLSYFDASLSEDYEDAKDLNYRWDFNNDDSWDISWNENPQAQFEFSDTDWSVKLEVRDRSNLVAQKILPNPVNEKEKIVFQSNTQDGGSEIYLVDVESKECRKLTNKPEIWKRTPRISPDRSTILFTQRIDHKDRPFIIDLAGTVINELDIFSGKNVVAHDWSPDGQEILITENGDLYKYHIFDGNTTPVFSDNQYHIHSASWSPTGEWIAMVSVGLEKNISLVKPDGSLHHRIAIPDNFRNYGGLAFSPDGMILAFHSEKSNIHTPDIFRISIGGGSLKQLTNTKYTAEYSPTWSPDGSMILFTKSSNLYLMDNQGSELGYFLVLVLDQVAPHWR